MPLPRDIGSDGIVFLDHPIVQSVRLFIWSDIVTMISHERLGQFLIKLSGNIH